MKLGSRNNSVAEIHDKERMISKEEGCVHILRGLISYHERMTMGYYPERDFYLEALRFALACVEEKLSQ